MLVKVTVGPNTYSLWKPAGSEGDTVWVDPGEYYCVRGWMKKEHKETFKQRMAPLACNDASGKFCWLLPYERWVKDVYDGRLYSDPYTVEDTKENRHEIASALGVSTDLVHELRSWQRQFLYKHDVEHGQGKDYRRAAVVRVGGGKSLVGLLLARRFDRPVVLAPAYVHRSWIDEAKKWGLDCPTLSTYQSAHKIGGADCVLMDEVLLAANPNTKIHGNALELSRTAKCVVGLTGTPQSTSPMDLRWLRAISPGCVPAEEKPWRFLFGKDTKLVEVKPGLQAYTTGEWDHNLISRFISPYVHTVRPEEVLRELPEITYQTITVPAPEQYKLILKGAATERGKSKALAQARMCTDGAITDDDGRILAELNTAKCDVARELVTQAGEAVIIFARWDFMVDKLARLFAPCSVLRSGADYGKEIGRFLDGETSVLVANAGISQGMNLQGRCRIVIFCSWSLKPTDREQAIGRVWRPGQRDGVLVYDIVAEGTLDETTVRLLEKHKGRNEGFIESALAEEFRRQVSG